MVKLLLITQLCLYVISLILSLCIIVPMCFHSAEFKGHCLLFSTGSWQDNGQFLVVWASRIYCDYTIFIGILSFLVSAVQIYRFSVFAYRNIDSSFLSWFVDVVTSWLMCLFIFIASIFITRGFISWCENMTERFPSCDIAAGNDIDKADDIITNGFFIEMGTAQMGIWSSWVCWVGLAVCATIKMWRYHQIENMRVSMYRERQKLINEGAKLQAPNHI